MKKIIYILLVFCFIANGFAQQTPASPQKEAITIEGAVAHLGDGTVIKNSLIMFEEGKITFIGDAKMRIARKGQIIDAKGKHVYPGFIAACTVLGLVEVDAVRASDDQAEIGGMIPHVRSLIAYNSESKVIESMRPNGVLMAQIAPRGGVIPGTSSVVQLDAWNWEDAAVKTDDGIHLHWPSSYRKGRWWMGEPRGMQPNKTYKKDINSIVDFIVNAKAYNETTAKPFHQEFAAMEGLFSGEQKMYVYADGEKEIIDAVTTLKENNIKNVVLVGGYNAYKITDFLKKNNIPVLVRAMHNLPSNNDDDYDLPYKMAKLLTDEGLLVGIQNNGEANFQNRNLPFYAGHAVAYGMEKEAALQLITSNTAKILGIDKTHGTLAVGKSATLFISEGDALEMRTNKLQKAFIDGRDVSLETHQTELYKRYMGKYKRGE